LPEVRRTRFLSDEELFQLEQIMPPAAWKLVAFAIETGMRREEQFQLRWDQIDLEAGVATIPLPKGGKTRHVPLSEGAKDICGPWIHSYGLPGSSLAQSFRSNRGTPKAS
jgi:integrase